MHGVIKHTGVWRKGVLVVGTVNSNPIVRAGFMGVQSVLSHKTHAILKFLIHFEQENLHFYFVLDPQHMQPALPLKAMQGNSGSVPMV